MTRPKITSVNFYDVLRATHGGSICVRGLNNELSKWFDVALVTFHEDLDIYFDKVSINEHFYVTTIAKPNSLKETERAFYSEADFEKVNLLDPSMTAGRYYSEIPEFVASLQKIAVESTVVITEHPYTYRLIKRAVPEKRIWYRAHNVEYDYKDKTWQRCDSHDTLLEELFELEKECCDGSELILTITQADADRFNSLYGVPKSKLLNISAGIDLSTFVLPSERGKLNPDYSASALFISSYAEAAIDAAMRMLEIARKTPMVMYYIIGSVCQAIDPDIIPDNVRLMGIVSEEEKERFFSSADVALNLIEGGGGMNVKMLEYFAFGLPTIATEFGVRGVSADHKTHCIITSLERAADDILLFCNMSMAERDKMAKNAYELVKRDYSWDASVNRILSFLSVNNKSLYETVLETVSDADLPDADVQPEEASLDKEKKYFVFGAGKLGKRCINMLSNIGTIPVGVVDNNQSLWGSSINGIPIRSPKELFLEGNADIIVAAGMSFTVDILRQLVDNNIQRDRIYIAIGGTDLHPCGRQTGDIHHYYDFDKILTLKERGKL